MGDINDHMVTDREGLETVISAFGIVEKNEGEHLTDFCVRNRLTIMIPFTSTKRATGGTR